MTREGFRRQSKQQQADGRCIRMFHDIADRLATDVRECDNRARESAKIGEWTAIVQCDVQTRQAFVNAALELMSVAMTCVEQRLDFDFADGFINERVSSCLAKRETYVSWIAALGESGDSRAAWRVYARHIEEELHILGNDILMVWYAECDSRRKE